MNIWPHFTNKELNCRCGCGQQQMNHGFMEKIVALRVGTNVPMTVTSGFRCSNHPEEKKKVMPGSHGQGRGLDCLVNGADVFLLVSAAADFGITGIGLKQHGPHDQRMLHLDDMEEGPGRPRPHLWTYA